MARPCLWNVGVLEAFICFCGYSLVREPRGPAFRPGPNPEVESTAAEHTIGFRLRKASRLDRARRRRLASLQESEGSIYAELPYPGRSAPDLHTKIANFTQLLIHMRRLDSNVFVPACALPVLTV